MNYNVYNAHPTWEAIFGGDFNLNPVDNYVGNLKYSMYLSPSKIEACAYVYPLGQPYTVNPQATLHKKD
jgi:hypothetical protein